MTNIMNTGEIKRSGTSHVDITSRLTGRHYEGDFTWRRRTLGDMGEIAAVQSRMTGGEKIVEENMALIITAIAELTVVIEDSPEWWAEVKDIPDTGVIQVVYREYINWLTAPFRKLRDGGGG